MTCSVGNPRCPVGCPEECPGRHTPAAWVSWGDVMKQAVPMMDATEIEEALKVAISAQDHDAYAAAARIGWPDALLDLRERIAEIDDLSATLLKQHKALMAADTMVQAAHAYIVRFAKFGPYNADKEASKLIEAMQEYRELRGGR